MRPILTASALSAPTRTPPADCALPFAATTADAQPGDDADHAAQGGGQGAVDTCQKPADQRQGRGGDQLPPQNGADRPAQGAKTGVHRSAPAKPRDFSVLRHGRSTRCAQHRLGRFSAASSATGRGDRGSSSAPRPCRSLAPGADLDRGAEALRRPPPRGARDRGRRASCAAARAPRSSCCTSASVSRTDSPFAATRLPASIWRAPSSASSARAWPISSAPSISISCTGRASLSRRSRLVVALRERPTASAACSCVILNSSTRRCRPAASSIGFRFSRWMFSISDMASAASSGTSRTSAGTSLEARHLRRAPAPLAGDQLVAVAVHRAHQERLHQALRADRGGELGERLLVHLRARLVLARAGCAPTGSVSSASRGDLVAAEQRVEPAAQSLGLVHAGCPLSENFVGEREVGLRALRGRVPQHRGHAVARRLGEPHVARHQRAVHLVAEVRLELLRHLLRERVARVVHRAQQPGDLELPG